MSIAVTGCGAVINLGAQPQQEQLVIWPAHLFLMGIVTIPERVNVVRAQTAHPVVHIQLPTVERDIIKAATVVYAVRTIRVLVHMVQPVVILIQG